MILAIDAGNTRVKWGLNRDGVWLAKGAVAHADSVRLSDAWKPFGAPQSVVVANVAGEKMRSNLGVLLSRFRAPIVWLVASAAQCGVSNRYDNPAQLGADRWAALIAAHRLHDGACLVVNAGTAMTVDALSANGEFLGGLIVPGLRLMMDSLSFKTAAVKVGGGNVIAFPRNTSDAVASGVVCAAAGAIERMRHNMGEAGHAHALCVLSGGAAEAIEPHLPAPVKRVDNLVLEGLLIIAQS